MMKAWIVSTYNPAVLTKRRDPNQAATIFGHLQLVSRILDGTVQNRADIQVEGPRPPGPDDPRIASIDIETYGSVKRDGRGCRVPRQSVFHPARMVVQDGVKNPTITVAVTPCGGSDITSYHPLPSPVFHMHRAKDRLMLIRWLQHLDTIIGQNLPYDLSGLRHELSCEHLSARSHRLIELSVMNYLHCEIRLERSLKDLSNVLGTHQYDPEMGKFDDPENLFPNPFRPNRSGRTLPFYNVEDTVTTVLSTTELAKRIERQYPDTAKLTDTALLHFSDLVWRCTELSEAGLCYRRRELFLLEDRLRHKIGECERIAKEYFGLIISGEGSEKSRRDYLYRCVDAIDKARPETESSILSDPRVTYTEKTGKLGTSDVNRYFFLTCFHDCMVRHPELVTREARSLFRGLRLFTLHGRASKVLGTFLYPLLYHQRGNTKNQKGLAVPLPGQTWDRPLSPEQIAKREAEVRRQNGIKGKPKKDDPDILAKHRSQPRTGPRAIITYPTYYPVPASEEGDPDAPGGGTQQGRITAKHHSIATDPPEIRKHYTSRWPGGLFVSWDLSQAELRTPGIITGEPSLVRAYAEGRDLHWERAETVYEAAGMPLPKEFGPDYRESKEAKALRRRPAKHFNFGDLFLAWAKTLQLTILRLSQQIVPIEICQLAVDQRPELRPVLWEWQQSVIRRAIQDNYIELPITGQSRLFLGSPSVVEETYASTIVNFPIQTTAANILHDIHNRIASRLPDPKSRNPWAMVCYNKYDALGFDVRARHRLPELKGIVAEALAESSETGYIARLYDHYGNHVPIIGDWSDEEDD